MMLPPLKWVTSPNFSGRNGQKIDLIVAHDCEGSYQGSISWFSQRASQVSAHYVLREDGAEATQMVELENKSWHACNFNPRSIGVEMAGFAKKGFGAPEWSAAADIIAWLLKSHGIPARWAEKGIGAGFCSHYDLGAAGGGHNDPTTDPVVWNNFVVLVQTAYQRAMPDSWGPSSRQSANEQVAANALVPKRCRSPASGSLRGLQWNARFWIGPPISAACQPKRAVSQRGMIPPFAGHPLLPQSSPCCLPHHDHCYCYCRYAPSRIARRREATASKPTARSANDAGSGTSWATPVLPPSAPITCNVVSASSGVTWKVLRGEFSSMSKSAAKFGPTKKPASEAAGCNVVT